ncbi:MAG: type II toxin-antitoxin system HigA family antitoxin [Leptolyngbyaceae cyanobacterium]
MAITVNTEIYSALLAKYQPKAITSEAEYNKMVNDIERLMNIGEDLTPEESSLLETLAILVEAYEDSQSPLEPSSPRDVLLHLMEMQGLEPSSLVSIMGSKDVISEIMDGERAISELQAKALGKFFNISPSLFV